MTQITEEQLRAALPSSFRNRVSQEVLDDINQILSDEDIGTAFRENLVCFTSVLQEGKYSLTEYVNAVKYVSYKAMGDTNIQAYCKVFPDRLSRWNEKGIDDKTRSSYVSIYNKTQLVNKITERVLVPSWILNQDLFQKALNTQAEIMCDSRASFVARSKAADSLLNALKRPEAQKIDLNVNQKESVDMLDLKASLKDLVDMQTKLIRAGSMSAKDICERDLIVEGEYVENSR